VSVNPEEKIGNGNSSWCPESEEGCDKKAQAAACFAGKRACAYRAYRLMIAGTQLLPFFPSFSMKDITSPSSVAASTCMRLAASVTAMLAA